MRGARREAALRLAAWLSLWLLLGLVFDRPSLFLLIGGGLYIGWMFWQASRLIKWMQSPEEREVPESSGLWGEIFSNLYQQQARSQKDRRQLASMLQDFQASTAALPDAVVVVDSSDHIAWCNEAAITLLGLTVPHDLGQRIVNLLRHPAFVNAYNRQQYETDILIPSPMDPQLSLTLRIVAYGEGQKLVMARDVSHIEQMERSRRDFVANASHELRTPLTVIRGYLEMMEDESAASKPLSPWREPLTEMSEQAARMAHIIDDLLKLARTEALAPGGTQEVINVPQMLAVILDEARTLSKGKHTFQLDIQPDAMLFGHPSELHSVFSNLIFNAVHYTPKGGEIQVCWSARAGGLHFSVTDTGVGIEQRHIPRLTERFYRADAARSRRTGGTGLGLAIVKHALEHHDSHLNVASEVNVGSTFSCDFPLSRLYEKST